MQINPRATLEQDFMIVRVLLHVGNSFNRVDRIIQRVPA